MENARIFLVLTLYENSRFRVRKNLGYFNMDTARKTYMKIVMDFVEV